MPPPVESSDLRRLAIVHYHLQPGGVTTVIENSLAALRAVADIDTAVISGRPSENGAFDRVEVVSALDYQAEPAVPNEGASTLADQLETAARRAFGGQPPDLWHCHNHSLGKIAALPDALSELARRGHRLLLQIHDFAEDGRPPNYTALQTAEDPYPRHPNVHYATINTRDATLLKAAGLAASTVTVLPNPLAPPPTAPLAMAPAIRTPLMLYPTRGIRRKNLGEAVLLAALTRDKAQVATTRTPENPAWQGIHARWETFAKERLLPITFGVVDRQSPADLNLSEESDRSFASWIHAASTIITTSVAEGFGLAYLESALNQRPLMGRDLPEITADFNEVGLSLPGLYRAIRIPLEWIGESRLVSALDEGLKSLYHTHQQPLPHDATERALRAMQDHHGRVDFGKLPEDFQETVIDHLLNEGEKNAIIFETHSAFANAELWLDSWFEGGMGRETLPQQRQIIEEAYAPDAYGQRLLHCYAALFSSSSSAPPSPSHPSKEVSEHLLHAFLSPESFQFLRS